MKRILQIMFISAAGLFAQDHDEHAGHDHAGHDHEKPAELTADAHEGHDHDALEANDHEAHAENGEGIELSDEMMEKTGIRLRTAGAGTVAHAALFPAEIKLNRDRTSAVSSRYPSIVRQVFAEIGDVVRKGDVLASLENRETLAVYTVQSPRDGVIISKDLAVGEAAPEDRVLYEVADLSSVWADIRIFPRYQHLVRKGMKVQFAAHDGHTAQGTIQYISPLISHETRTFTARCVLEDAREDFTPGAFVRARITIKTEDAAVAVPSGAVQVLDGEQVVFVPGEHGFQALPVQTGLSDGQLTQIISGLHAGDEVVAEGAFVLKAQMITAGMDPHAGHGH